MKAWIAGALSALSLAGAARAEVVGANANGFRLKSVVQISASPERVYRAIGEIGRWWDPAHTYSGDARNLSIALQAGGCWCETVPPNGSVQHGVVVLASPGLGMIRASAPLGPLQDEGVSTALLFQTKPKDGGTELTVTYNVGGARDAILKAAPGVDGVLTGAWARLKRYVETGKP
ncbi:MAG: SRPBCC domain-containing protein [Phenylobacterium sp.]|uniref:SRPBCC family protein n=1 Tax=Phenylobacterium sp. TaxID=1871053 RepID=UPI001A3A8930|nr:SRPBCC domain-containing protein [Phenylobacterium sp.]MBL8553124.1 SRPBCC domain-containing protein [Phenylobacterium sp.]